MSDLSLLQLNSCGLNPNSGGNQTIRHRDSVVDASYWVYLDLKSESFFYSSKADFKSHYTRAVGHDRIQNKEVRFDARFTKFQSLSPG